MGTEREALVFNNSVSESETQTDGTLPNLREGCMRAGGVEETDGGMCGYQEIPDPLTNIPRPSHENLPVFYQVTPPQPFSPGQIANQP